MGVNVRLKTWLSFNYLLDYYLGTQFSLFSVGRTILHLTRPGMRFRHRFVLITLGTCKNVKHERAAYFSLGYIF